MFDPELYTFRYVPPPEYQAWSVDDIRRRAAIRRMTSILAMCDWAGGYADAALAAERAYRLANAPAVNPQASREADTACDELIVAMDTQLHGLALAGRLQPLAGPAAELRRQLFPGGVGEHVNATWLKELELTDTLITTLRGEPARAVVDHLQLRPLVDELERSNNTFRQIIAPVARTRWEDVVAAAKRGELAVRRLVSFVIGEVDPFTPEGEEALEDLLLSVQVANQRLRQIMVKRAHKRKKQEEACKDDKKGKDGKATDGKADGKSDSKAADDKATDNKAEDDKATQDSPEGGATQDPARRLEPPALDEVSERLSSER
jgi:hypothetical protein